MRSKGLDLIKIIAIITMVIDHTRFLSFIDSKVAIQTIIIVGRFAFPMFCFALAVNFNRLWETNNTAGINKYIKNLCIYSVLAQIPHMLMVSEPTTLNVMPTLLLGVLVMILFKSPMKHHSLLLGSSLLLIALISPVIMYGLTGVLLPLGCLIALQNKSRWWIALPLVIAPICNLEEHLISRLSFNGMNVPFTYLVCLTSSLSVAFCFYILNKKLTFNVWKVGTWGYWFYPIHMAGFYLLNCLISAF